MARIVRNLAVLMATIMLVAGAGVAALPATSASASTIAEVWFSGEGTGIQVCSDPGTFYYSGSVVEVYNPCSVRVWVHYTAGTAVQSFCVNPGGGIAYDLPITWASVDTTNIQVTTNSALCDDRGGAKGLTPIVVSWDTGLGLYQQSYNCDPAQSKQSLGEDTMFWIQSFCDFRIWVHANDDGSGASHCLDPNWNATVGQGIYDPPSETEFKQFLVSEIQAPCAAGSPPYAV
jgi:hypothetical protein